MRKVNYFTTRYSIGVICALLVACDSPTPEKTSETNLEVKTAPTKSQLDLSFDNITIENKQDEWSPLSETNSELFNTLNGKPEEPQISFSGNVILDKKEDYLKAIDGGKISIEIKTP